MQTKKLIQAQANILEITALKKGDVIKLVDTEYSSPKLYYGIVIDLLNQGGSSFIQILQYKTDWSNDLELKQVLFNGEDDIKLFPASKEELKDYFSRVEEDFIKKIKEDEKKLDFNKRQLKKLQDLVSGELSKKLTEASYEEITQEEYDNRLLN